MLPPILVVDDDAAVRNMITRQLSDSYEITQSENAEEALALALRHKPRCILLDFNLPGYSGPELCLHS